MILSQKYIRNWRLLKKSCGKTLSKCRRFIIFIHAAIVINLLLFSGMTQAQHGHQSPVVLESITVTAEKISDYVKNHPQQATILGQKEIDERQILNVEDALGVMPGVDVRRSAGIGARISIRGSGKTGGVLVLLNGRPLNTSQYGNVDLSGIPIDTIKSITVFKPPVPVWLGPGADEGAISIVTHDIPLSDKKTGSSQTRLKLSGGSYGLAEISASQYTGLKAGSLMLAAVGSHRDGKRANADKDNGTFNFHWDREGRDNARFETDLRYYTAEYGFPGPTDNPTPDARQSYQKGSVDTRMRGPVGGFGDYAVNVYGDVFALKDKSQTGVTSDLDDIRIGIRPETHWRDSDIWSLRIGGALEREDMDQTIAGKHHRVSSGLSAQYDRNLDKITGTMGLRYDHTGDFGYYPGGSAGLSYSMSKRLLARANAGYRVNIPAFGQLYQPSHGSIDQVRGNPDLDPEKIRSYDIGLEYRMDKGCLFQFSIFRADTCDIIIYQRGGDMIYRPVNVDKAYRHGIEVTSKYTWDMSLGVDGSFILQDSENRQTGNSLPYTPEIKVRTTFQYALPTWRTRLETTLRYEGEQYSEAENRTSEKLDDYVTMDIKAVQPFSVKGVASEWFVQVDNLWDTGFEAHHGYPDDGIRFVTGVSLVF